MRGAESVTFGGSGLDRAADLRGDAAALARAAAAPAARVLPVWRGKPLVTSGAGGGRALCAVPPGGAPEMLSAGPGTEVFLGRSGAAPWFARDVSDWEPDGAQPRPARAFHDPTEQIHPDAPSGSRFADLRMVMTALSPRDAELAATARAVLGWHGTHRFCARCGAASAPAEGGWQRLCPDCGARHFPRTDPVVIMLVTHGDAVLLGRAPGWPEGMYSLLAGFMEPGETIEAAVRREVMEEVGVPVGAVGYLASQPWPFPASLMIGCHGAALGREITLDPVEIEDALWLERGAMLEIAAGRDARIRPARPGAIAHFLLRRWLADDLA